MVWYFLLALYMISIPQQLSLSVCGRVHACVCEHQTMQAEANCHITYMFWHCTFLPSTSIYLRHAMSRNCIEMQHLTLKAI